MEMIHALYLGLFGFAMLHFTVLKPNIDGFSVALVGVTFYYLPALIGRGGGPLGPYSIHPVVYIFSCFVVLSLILGDIFIPRIQIENKNLPNDLGSIQVRILTVVTVILFFILLIQFDPAWLGAAKKNIPSPFSAKLLRYFIPVTFIAAWVYNDWKYLSIVGSALVFYTVLLQVRSPVAITLISVFLYELYTRKPSIRNRIRIGIVGSGSGFLIVFFDKVKGHVLSGNVSILFEIDRNLNQVIYNNNSHLVFQIYNRTLQNQYRISNPIEHLSINILNIIPLAETLFGIPTAKYSVIIRAALFPSRTAGVGSNIWAEVYALSGFIGIGIALFIFLSGLAVLSAQLRSETWCIQLFALSTLPYWTFFNHRLTLGAILSTMSIIAIICFVPPILIKITQQTVPHQYRITARNAD